MTKKYQVFISSTFSDLRNARQEVSQALLRSDCFPAQMEQWPATDAGQFEFIKQVIDECDYYIVVSAGMYGSTHPGTGISYTEMEYDYAQEQGIPTIRLLHKDPFKKLTGAEIEDGASAKKKLKAFRRKLLNGKLCAFWETPAELGREVILSLNDIKTRKPSQGWVKANKVASSEAIIEIAELKQEISELRLLQAEEPASERVEQFLKSLDGIIELSEYKLMSHETEQRLKKLSPFDALELEEDYLFAKTMSFRLRQYVKTGSQVEMPMEEFAHGILHGLLVESSSDSAILRGFSSRDVDASGYPTILLTDADPYKCDDLFMKLERDGIIVPGEKSSYSSIVKENSFSGSYPWTLTRLARSWALKNPLPKRC